MQTKWLLSAFLCGLVLLAVLHNVALQFFLYWTYRWLDIPMHILGGAVVALGYQTFLAFRSTALWNTAMPTMLAALLVGIGWEVFELAFDLPMADSYAADTAFDLCMDVLGGAIGYTLARRVGGT